MFYSHEILTNRRYGVATVWLVATLGAKSSTKKVTKKAILDVEIKKACETIMEPEAPMALRLQSNLLYGVSRVYSQQCGYVLADAQIIQSNLRTLIKVTRTAHNELDPEAGKARSDQLIIADDPAFLPDMALPPLELDFSGLELHGIDVGESQRSMMSPGRRASSASSSQNSASILGLNLPSSSINGGAGSYQLPDPFSGSSANKQIAGTGRIFDEEEQALFDDGLNLDFGFDADGNLLGFTDEELEQRRRAASRAASIIRPAERLGSDSAASGRVRAEHQEARTGRDDPPVDEQGYFDMMQYGEEMLLPDAEPFPFMSGANPDAGHRDPLQQPSSPQPSSETESAEAPQKRRKARKPKTLPVDRELEHSNSQLLRWQREYSNNMAKAVKEKEVYQKASQSKKVAYNYVWGSGIGGVGYGIGSTKYQSPLAMFSGETLMARLKGSTTPKVKTKKANKRSLETDNEDDSNSEGRRVRARGEEEEVGRGVEFNDDMMMAGDDSMGLEVGRDAPSALDDHRSSNMPWNVSASVHSYQRGHSQPSSSLQGRGSHIPSSTGRRIPTSPLIGRGSNIPGDLEHFSQLQDADLPVMYGRSDDEDDDAILRHTSKGLSISSSQATGAGARFNENEETEFEIFGAAANVDTQTAGSSQWIREALDRESHNFFEYVKNSISEKQKDELDESDDGDDGDVFGPDKGRAGKAGRGMKDKWVTFEELFVPEKNSRIVAAQAFLHVLSLATKGRVWVVQDDDENEAYGEIRIGCLGV